MTNYRRGYTVERAAVQFYRNRGYNIVFRSAGSRGPFDVVAINTELQLIVLAQCKRSKRGHFPKVHFPQNRSYYVMHEQMNWTDGKGFQLKGPNPRTAKRSRGKPAGTRGHRS